MTTNAKDRLRALLWMAFAATFITAVAHAQIPNTLTFTDPANAPPDGTVFVAATGSQKYECITRNRVCTFNFSSPPLPAKGTLLISERGSVQDFYKINWYTYTLPVIVASPAKPKRRAISGKR